MCSDTTRTMDTLCEYPNCTRTVWKDPDGSFSSFCGNSHRLAMREVNQASTTGSTAAGSSRDRANPSALCKNCNARPVYVENGFSHPFCGRRCAAAFRQGSTSRVSRAQSLTPPVTPPSETCALYGCERNVFVSNGQPSRFCSRRHMQDSVRNGQFEGCLLCATKPKAMVNGKLSDFCSRRCAESAIDAAPAILQLSPTDASYEEVQKQFTEQWKHPSTPGAIVKIWRIMATREAYSRFSRYQLSIERLRNIPDGNSRRRWHGTVRNCCLGDEDYESTLCDTIINGEECSLCGIIKSSFQITRSGQRFNFGRFGAGIYTTGTSSKANDYVQERGGSPYRALFLNDVVLGKTQKLTSSSLTLTQPPAGHDSVVGEPGGDLNYDEAVVYNNDAIRPLFLVIFSTV